MSTHCIQKDLSATPCKPAMVNYRCRDFKPTFDGFSSIFAICLAVMMSSGDRILPGFAQLTSLARCDLTVFSAVPNIS